VTNADTKVQLTAFAKRHRIFQTTQCPAPGMVKQGERNSVFAAGLAGDFGVLKRGDGQFIF